MAPFWHLQCEVAHRFLENWYTRVLENLNSSRLPGIESMSLNHSVIFKAIVISAIDIEGVF
jgi:hypothetical protein